MRSCDIGNYFWLLHALQRSDKGCPSRNPCAASPSLTPNVCSLYVLAVMLSCQECLYTAVCCGKLQACCHPPSTQSLAIIIPFLSFSSPTAGSWELLCITPLKPLINSIFLTFPSLPFYFSSSKYKSTLAGHLPAAAPLSSPCPTAGSPLIPLCGKRGYKTPFLPRSSVKVWQ